MDHDPRLPSPRAPSPRPLPAGCRFALDARADGVVGVEVVGDLDPASARTLVELVESAVGTPGTSRQVEIDLRRLRSCSNSGVRALTACAELGARVRDGIQFRVGIAPDGIGPRADPG
jgi:hypothetical protein